MSGGYQTNVLANFRGTTETSNFQSTLQYANTTILAPELESAYSGPDPVTYSARDLLNGYIVRDTSAGNNVYDLFDSASNIIAALQQRIITLSGIYQPLQNGTKFSCLIYANAPENEVDNTDYGISFWSTNDFSIIVGGNPTQITGGAVGELTFIVRDQARFGEGHIDQLFVCTSRCSTVVNSPILIG